MEENYMKIALKEANNALSIDEVPIGAVLVDEKGKVVAKNHNQKEKNKCCLDHAEILVIREASKVIGNWRLNNCSMYVTVQPCPMCMSAIKQARINKVYYGCSNKNVLESHLSEDIAKLADANMKIEIHKGILEEECQKILSTFFSKKR